MAVPMNPLYEPDILIPLFLILLASPIIIPPSPEDPHLLLTRVCSRWRNIILSRPFLWDQFVFHPRPFRDAHQLRTTFHAFIARSASNSLAFYFHTDFYRHDQENSADLQSGYLLTGAGRINIVVDFINPYVLRLKYLKVFLSLREHAQFLLDLPQTVFPALEEIIITVVDNVNHPCSSFTIEDCRPFHSFPRLAAVIHQMMNGVYPLMLHLPWPYMTKLNFGSTTITPPYFMEIMGQSQGSLTEAYFTVLFDPQWTNIHHGFQLPIDMTSLTKLRLRLFFSSLNPNFVFQFRFPVIKDLWIGRMEQDFPFDWEIEGYTDLFSGSSASLESLRFSLLPLHGQPRTLLHGRSSRPRTSYGLLEKLFKAVPRLNTLWLPVGITIHPPTLVDIARGDLLPRLAELRLSSDTDPRLVFDVVRTRNASGSTSRSGEPFTITSVDLVLPYTTPYMDGLFKAEAEALMLSGGCRLDFIGPCVTCGRFCYFGN